MGFNTNQPTYQRLRRSYAERRKDLAFWVGAGASRPAGLPTWSELLTKLKEDALEGIVSLPEEAALIREAKLQQIDSIPNLWLALQTLRDFMGETNFRAAIQDIFSGSEQTDPPDIYNMIWSLTGVLGLLTLNIDDFAGRAHRLVRPRENAAAFCGRDAPGFANLVSRRKPFIANLHGIHENPASWILTQKDLAGLVRADGYAHFINFVLQDLTIVFLGISTDDVAVGGFLEKLTQSGVNLGQHFWITHRQDANTRRWSDSAGVQIVAYEPDEKDGKADHATPIREILSDLERFVSVDTVAPTIVAPVPARTTLPTSKHLKTLNEDELRSALAGYAKNLTSNNNEGTESSDYRRFLREYSIFIHQAWHLTSHPPYNKFFGYNVVQRVSSGPFSSVWRLTDSLGAAYALKIIQIDNLEKGAQLESFRRGVQSLDYLTHADVPGIAKLVAAYEIPTSVIMEFVEGATLVDVVQSGQYRFWNDGLKIMLSVCAHLEMSHNLPQGVLHRDVRPSNIMVPHYFESYENDEKQRDVQLLNYDMSWHAKAKGRTIAGSIEEAGYYAPEQIEDIDGELARSTFVDSYGLGMSIFYAYTGNIPPTGGSKSTDWTAVLSSKFKSDSTLRWRSAPERLKRIVRSATAPRASDRLHVRQIRSDLQQLLDALEDRRETLSPDFWAEEVFAHSVQGGYEVDRGEATFSKVIRHGRQITLRGDLKDKAVCLKFSNQATESTNRSGMDKHWKERLEAAKAIITAGGWTVNQNTRYAFQEIVLEASVEIDLLATKFQKIVTSLERALDKVRLD